LWLRTAFDAQDFDMVKLHEKYAADVLQAEEELERVVNQNKP